jgi:uncharacterized RDD family membrane protein YckC
MSELNPGGRASVLLIRTPEGIVFSLPLAGPITRFLAYAVDFAAIMVAAKVLRALASLLTLLVPDFSTAVAMLGLFVIQIGYSIACEWYWRGQTIGKKLLRLRVMDAQGLRLQFSQIVMRNLLRFVDVLPGFYLVGGLACLFSRRAQRLGDVVANTIVVRNVPAPAPRMETLLAGKFNSLRDYPHLEARLRQRVTPGEAAVALQALLRRDRLEARARVELFDEIAARFHSLVQFPPEATEGLSPEQYVGNVLDVLFRPRIGQRP